MNTASGWTANEAYWQGVDDEPIAGSENLVKSGSVYADFKDVSKDFNCIARYSGTTGTGYNFVQEVSIPSGVVVRNTGTGRVVLYDIKSSSSPNSLDLQGGETKVTTFAITWIKGRSATDLPYNIFVYADKDSIITSNGTLIKTAVENNASAIAALNDTVSVLPNKVDIKCGSNILDLNDPYYVEGKYLSPAGNLLTSQDYDASGYIKVDASTTYHVSGDGNSALAATDGVYVGYYLSDKTLISTEAGGANKTNFTTPANCAYMRISIKKTNLPKAMVEKGSSRGEYNVYNPIGGYLANVEDEISSVKGSVQNLSNVVEDKVDVSIGVNLLNPNDADYIENKYLYSNGALYSSDRYDVSGYIEVEPSETYNISGDLNSAIVASDGAYVCYYSNDKTLIDVEEGGSSKTNFTTPANCKYLRASLKKDLLEKAMVKKGSARGSYESYTPIGGYLGNVDRKFVNVEGEIHDLSDVVGENSILSYSDVPVGRFVEDRYISSPTSKYATENENFDLYQYYNIPNGTTIRFKVQCIGNPPVVARVQDTESFTSDNNIQNITDVVSGHWNSFTIPTGMNVLDLIADSGTVPDVEIVNYLKDTVLEMDEDIKTIEQTKSLLGADATIVKANDLESALEHTNFPTSNKFGDKYQFGCKVTSFSGIKICRGYETYRSRWFEIDDTNVSLVGFEYSGGVTEEHQPHTIETIAHGLTISRMLNVNINITSDGHALFMMQTLGGSYSHEFSGWGYDANGVLKVINDGSTLSDCVLTATNAYFRCPIWIFGASYEGVNTSRWPGQMKAMGYFDFLINAYAGRSGSAIIADFNRALAYGCPKYLYYTGGNDLVDSTFATNFSTIKNLCITKGITLIAPLHPDTPERNYSYSRSYTANPTTGSRYVDLDAAMHDPNKVWSLGVNTWYNGFLSSDLLHPSVMGAKAMAMQFCMDFPETMQYSKTGEGGNAPDYDGGDE